MCQGHKNRAPITTAGELISHYRPHILVLENVASKACRRCGRVLELVEALDHYGRERGLTVRKIAQTTVKRTFGPLGARNKNQLARYIATQFPELARYVPPERKPWMSEDPRTAIFDAAAFALALLRNAGRHQEPFAEADILAL
jgi:hypothetical protein